DVADPAGHRARLRARLADLVRVAVDPHAGVDLRPRHAPDDRPDVRARHLVLRPDDDLARRELRADALARARPVPARDHRPARCLSRCWTSRRPASSEQFRYIMITRAASSGLPARNAFSIACSISFSVSGVMSD